MLNVGLVGLGFAGKTFHAPVIRVVEGLRLTTIVQRHGGGAPDPRYADVEFVRSVDELLSRAVDLVVIATPNTSHHPIAKQCLQAGRHVVIDKPFTTTVAEADELVQLGAAQRRVLSIYQNRRYVGDFVTLRALLSQGALGRVTMFEAHFDRFRPELRPRAWREQSRPAPASGSTSAHTCSTRQWCCSERHRRSPPTFASSATAPRPTTRSTSPFTTHTCGRSCGGPCSQPPRGRPLRCTARRVLTSNTGSTRRKRPSRPAASPTSRTGTLNRPSYTAS